MPKNISFNPDLIRRYDLPGPRYTSFPTADRFVDVFDSTALEQHLARRASDGVLGGIERGLSLYFHIPFCNTVCYYCGCNKIVTKDRSLADRYISYLDREMSMQTAFLSGSRQVSQMHWGGGTPTFLDGREIVRLMRAIREHFQLKRDGEYSIEIDPRKVSNDKVALLADEGFNRMSIGVQDFDPLVQMAVNRVQSIAETRSVVDSARTNGFRSVSMDLIYGLPLQDVSRFANTLDSVLEMQPDRLALYSYAHLPARFMPQRRIDAGQLPAPEEKLALLALAIEKLGEAGYVYIGMDHFARPDDELAVAQRRGSLHRNFQGYSTHAECDLLAFGVSAISSVGGAYSQNEKDLAQYYAAIDRGDLPVMRGWVMSSDDMMRHAIIQSLMCHFELSLEAIEQAFGINFRETFAYEIAALRPLEDAGLVRLDGDWLSVTEAGRMLVRVVAMVFDNYLRRDSAQPRYSKVI
ncbi:oxygen-independent coproporphyrinogen III oxidase [Viridibacterium curvum]|uniref:Coproporphyrinogen-III oxidase n=1 Tax=Viridibacterium curvum TaxID=1101404 RepID=A0ABP9Q6S6_9RHOO